MLVLIGTLYSIVLKGRGYLEQALNAILKQTYSDFELIISDNASTDRTEEICRAYAARDKRVRYYRNPTNLGASKNFNQVFELSRGTYFRWATYDDLVAPQTIERCIEVLEKEPDVILCYPKTINIDENGNILDYYEDDFAFGSPDPRRRFRDFLQRVYPYNSNAMFGLIRRSALERTSLISNYNCGEKVLLAQLVLKGQFREVPEFLFSKRFHACNSSAVCKTEREFADFLDTSRKGRFALLMLRRNIDFLKTVYKSPLNWRRKAYCYGSLAMWYVLETKRWKALRERILSRILFFASSPMTRLAFSKRKFRPSAARDSLADTTSPLKKD